jgi:hypothetical protein
MFDRSAIEGGQYKSWTGQRLPLRFALLLHDDRMMNHTGMHAELSAPHGLPATTEQVGGHVLLKPIAASKCDKILPQVACTSTTTGRFHHTADSKGQILDSGGTPDEKITIKMFCDARS